MENLVKTLLINLFLSTSLAASASAQVAGSRDARGPMDFKGRFLVSAQDADMVASAYVNGLLGPREGRDTLAVIPLEGDPRGWRAQEVFASNSVGGPPAVVDLSPDGRYAVVIETWTERPQTDEVHRFSDLAFGNRLTVVDLSDPASPRTVQEIEGPARPEAVRFSPDGSLLAVSYHPAGGGKDAPLALYRFADGRLGEMVRPEIDGWDTSQRLIDLDWHPAEPILALVDGTGGATLRFARVTEDLAVEPFGNVVDIERAPFRAIFTPNGKHVVLSGLYWGPDIQGLWTEAPRGSVLTVRMNAETREDGTVRHAFVDRSLTGVSPEGLAVSPDGRWVATTNLERSYLPYDDKRITWYSSITLAALDQETGDLTEVGTFAYDGILPEAAVFDNSSSYLAVANYDHFDDRKEGSSIDFWRLQSDPLDPGNIQLIKTGYTVPVTRGAHSMVIAR